ncbi:MAG: hypothetical protein K5981_09345 [Clostridia bacterium]|nr:hypothetical protein [Clostridia bacterium]
MKKLKEVLPGSAARATDTFEPYEQVVMRDLKYLVVQATIRERIARDPVVNLTQLEDVINRKYLEGYRLHSVSRIEVLVKGNPFMGDTIRVVLVFERMDEQDA